MLTHCGTQSMETSLLLLRKFDYADNEAMLRYWVSDPDIQSLYSEPTYNTTAEVKGLLDKYITSYKRKDYYRWAIIDKDSNECVRQIAIFLVNDKNHFCEIEYCIGKQFQRKGYATKVVKTVINYAFSKVNFHKVQVCHKENNLASSGVIEKCGFIYEGTLRDYFFIDGKYVNRLYYSILKNECAL